MFPARQYQSNITKQPQWISMVAKTKQWASWKRITKIRYNLLHENVERKPPLRDKFYGDNEISAHFFRPNFEQVYLPWHLIAMIPIASPLCTEFALLALCWSWKLAMWASCWNRPFWYMFKQADTRMHVSQQSCSFEKVFLSFLAHSARLASLVFFPNFKKDE